MGVDFQKHSIKTFCEIQKFPALEEQAAVVALARSERVVCLLQTILQNSRREVLSHPMYH